MKILKKANKPTSNIRFVCPCGCEFIADKKEYDWSYDHEYCMNIYVCNCPECNNPCVRIKR